ncbi:hypothetical protein MPL3356_540058 [Mesorhizobium plurifarium]|uniref:Uncharacterized protein n=1 Tax=Mesorhizobium plurifarium TaxID=69974 RepID=A0A090E6P9_MESPL|nr:hypothetical protein MPL3356_540058 [Mesorhizobium plurifarium]
MRKTKTKSARSESERSRHALRNAGLEMDRLAIHNEVAISDVMDRLRFRLNRVDPGFQDLKDEQVTSVHQACIYGPAFEIGVALGDQGSRNSLGGKGRQPSCRELVSVASGAVSNLDDFFREANGRDRDYAFLRLTQGEEGEVVARYDAGDCRRRDPRHHVPGHGHDVRATLF